MDLLPSPPSYLLTYWFRRQKHAQAAYDAAKARIDGYARPGELEIQFFQVSGVWYVVIWGVRPMDDLQRSLEEILSNRGRKVDHLNTVMVLRDYQQRVKEEKSRR